MQNLIEKEKEFGYQVGSIVSFPNHESPKSKQRLSVKNGFNQHVQNLLTFETISVCVHPNANAAPILEPATKSKLLTASTQSFLWQASVSTMPRPVGPPSACLGSTSMQCIHPHMLRKSSTGKQELGQHPSCAKPKPLCWE